MAKNNVVPFPSIVREVTTRPHGFNLYVTEIDGYMSIDACVPTALAIKILNMIQMEPSQE